jgi:SepF-like predicted cell division protein (DUF552 family)
MVPLFNKKKDFHHDAEGIESGEEEYINLGDLLEKERGDRGVPASTYIKVADLIDVTDIQVLSRHVYDGNILVLNITNVARDKERYKKLTEELTKLVKDVDGDLAGIGPQILAICPSGIRIDRERIRVETNE